MATISSNRILDAAFRHVHQARLNDSPHSDIWSLSLNWHAIRSHLRNQLLSGTYQLSPRTVFRSPKAGYISRWSVRDSVVLKAIALCLSPHVGADVSEDCYHLTGRGGLKGACRAVKQALPHYRYVCKSDVAQYYESMDHHIIMSHIKHIVEDERVCDLIYHCLTCIEHHQGQYRHIDSGISKGWPLSPLIGGLFLKSLDASMPTGCHYVRYMDDWAILTRTRRQLRRVVKRMHAIMQRLKLKLAREKTFIGNISRGFDFLGYRFNHQGIISLAQKTILNFIERMSVLYEQGASSRRIADYVRRWQRWCVAGL